MLINLVGIMKLVNCTNDECIASSADNPSLAAYENDQYKDYKKEYLT